jgi:arylsulfatase A-like enzyme
MGPLMSKRLSRREFVKSASAGVSLLSTGVSTIAQTSSVRQPSDPRPNVIFILADDLGWGDLSCYGRPDYQTPNIDRLARQGTRFTNAYSASAVCTPTRCAFITGRYPGRLKVGLEEPLIASNDQVGLDPKHPTIASLLKKSGYETALIGKWHLGFRPEFGPNAHGFDEFFGLRSGAVDYLLHKTGLGAPDLYENVTPVQRNGYLTDLLTDHAVAFVSRRRTSPFYLSLHYNAPHWPWQGPQGGETIQFSTSQPEPTTMNVGGSLKIYADMVRSLDVGVGKVMKALENTGIANNTLIIFTSDNGGERFSYEWPLAGQKGDLLEGGIRVPAIVRWPRVVPAAQVTNQVAISMDWTATILSAANVNPDPEYRLDGENLLPVLRKTQAVHDRTLFWRMSNQDAVRSGRWKYVRVNDDKYLFDLSVDEREQADFKLKQPDTFNRLQSEFAQWESKMLPRIRRN